ncbi:ParB/RepB/Spo0J family partition protein [Phaeobacter gallaeciensis]|uniref:ParB/RepB/Spo0J family partition protein n=1 Tax=Phaeobacter gallaeciensis TaxID=60890 RepID=UPI0003D6D612|nr:ParB/RepB/Spo0J family partition protein [Phaeobacter gallaeciensis]AHD12120.1 plasmid partitioning protein parB [Phaeobacter gallaeciensis DSM 26640]
MARNIFNNGNQDTDKTPPQDSGQIADKLPSLAILKAASVQEKLLDTSLIDEWGPEDRLSETDLTAVKSQGGDADLTAVKSPDPTDDDSLVALIGSIETSGQSTPIEVRPSTEDPGRYQIICGRRRLAACRVLGIQVNARIQTLTDEQTLLRKGLENSNRRARSFYENAIFAQAIENAGYSRSVAAKALGGKSHASMSQLLRVGCAIPYSVGGLIGSAPQSGRPKWDKLATAFIDETLDEKTAIKRLKNMQGLSSDQRLERLIASLVEKQPQVIRKAPHGATIKAGQGALSISIKRTGANAKFADWLNGNIDRVIEKAHQEFQAVKEEQEE